LSGGEIEISIVILSWNTLDITTDCVESLLKFPPSRPWEVILIDNASSDGSEKILPEKYGSHPNFTVILNEKNLGFTGGNNQGIEVAQGNILILLNSDIILLDDSIVKTVDFLKSDDKYGVAGPLLVHDDGTPTTSFGFFPDFSSIFSGAFLPGSVGGLKRRALGVIPDDSMTEPLEIDYVSGAAFFIKREVIEKTGMFDAETFFAYFEETDWCWRIKKAGYKVMFFPGAKIVHLEGKSFERMTGHRRMRLYDSAKKFFRKHYSPPLLWWYMFCTVLGSILKVAYFGLRIMLQPSGKQKYLPHYHWNAFVFRLWAKGLGLAREARE
jgi:hypothetical protein